MYVVRSLNVSRRLACTPAPPWSLSRYGIQSSSFGVASPVKVLCLTSTMSALLRWASGGAEVVRHGGDDVGPVGGDGEVVVGHRQELRVGRRRHRGVAD